MGSFFWNALFLVVAIGILVTVHEFGHYWVARRCGVRVLRFSVGFGSPLLKWLGKDGTEYVVAAIPLGGYVKMLDEREGNVPPEQVQFAFNRQSVASRIAIVIAGPAFNFMFAVFAFWLMYLIGIAALKPVVGEVAPGSIAARAGLQSGERILRIDDEAVSSWEDVAYALVERVGETGELTLETEPQAGGSSRRYALALDGWVLEGKEPNPLESIGIKPFLPVLPAVIGAVQAEGPGQQAGLQAGDKVLRVDGQPIKDWADLVKHITVSVDKPLRFELERAGQAQILTVTPRLKDGASAPRSGYLGIGPEVPADLLELQHTVQFGPVDAFGRGVSKTWDISVLSVKMLGKLFTGALSIESLSGPISIARGAGASASGGIEYFLSFLALISINLGIINLLPVPMLDGGHLMYYLIESVRGRPLSERVQEFGLRIGMSLVLGLMLVAVYNDLARL